MGLRRLARMGAGEIAGRSRQKAAQWVDRLVPTLRGGRRARVGLATPAGDASAASAAFELFRHAAPRRFFPGVETGDAGEALREHIPAACRDVVAVANAVCSRRFDLLGYEGLSFGESVDWHLDPVSGRRAPRVHWSRIDPLDAAAVGDSKVTWELNRHQWLLPLAQAYWLTADERYAQEAADLVDDWSRANPYGMGINWSSSLEVAFRLISWSWAFVLIRDAGVLSQRDFAGVVARIRVHAGHVERYLSRYSPSSTRLTGEALGLFYASVLFPELPEAAQWRKLGRQILVDQCRRQVHDDGVHSEQTTCYQRYTIEIYLHFLVLADRNDVAVPADVRQRVERMLEFLLAVSGADGTMPQIGDADGGWLLPLVRRAPGDCRGTFAIAAAMFGRSDFLWAAGGPTPEVLWLLGTPGWDRLKALQGRAPSTPASAVFRDGGHAVLRSGWTRDAHHLVLDVGPLGCRGGGAHGHADLLSLQCTAFGEPYIVDPGTFCYTPDKNWRDYFRGTSAHSTVVVDKRPQAEPSGPFSWHTRPFAALRAWTTSEAFDLVDAFHDAYSSLSDPVRHRRRVLFVKPRYWVVIDDLIGQAGHDLEVRFQFAPMQLDRGPGCWVAAQGRRGEGLWLAPFSTVPLTLTVREGETGPPAGWVSTHYGRRQPAPMVVYAANARLPVRIATLILPMRPLGSTPPRVTVLHDAAGQMTALRLDDTGEIVHFDDERVFVESAEPIGAAPQGAFGRTR